MVSKAIGYQQALPETSRNLAMRAVWKGRFVNAANSYSRHGWSPSRGIATRSTSGPVLRRPDAITNGNKCQNVLLGARMMSSEKPNKQGEETSGKQPGPKPEPKNSGTFRDIWSAARKRAEMAHKTIGPPRSMREAMTRAKEIVDEEWQAQGLPRTLREAREMAKTKKDTHANSKAIDDRWQLKLDMLAREIEAAKVRDAIRKRKGEIVKEVETLQYDIEYLIACAYVHQYVEDILENKSGQNQDLQSRMERLFEACPKIEQYLGRRHLRRLVLFCRQFSHRGVTYQFHGALEELSVLASGVRLTCIWLRSPPLAARSASDADFRCIRTLS